MIVRKGQARSKTRDEQYGAYLQTLHPESGDRLAKDSQGQVLRSGRVEPEW